MPTKEREAKEKERPGRFLFLSLYFPLTFAHWLLLSLSGKKKIKRLEEVAVWHLVKKKKEQKGIQQLEKANC